MGELLALVSAVCYGVADFAGGLLSRRVHYAAVALVGQAGGLVVTLAVAPVVDPTLPSGAVLGWGALSGAGTGLGMVFLYRGLSRGAMSVVVPVSAVTGAGLPVLAAVVLLGDRPSVLAWVGIGLAVPALWFVAPRGRGGAAGVFDALLAGAGIALQYLALARAGTDAGIWPVAAGRLTASLAVLPLVLTARRQAAATPPTRGPAPSLPPPHLLGAAATGMTAALALVCYLAATGQGMVTVTVVLSSMYPAIPVVLGLTVLRERRTTGQLAGLVAATVSVVLLALG